MNWRATAIAAMQAILLAVGPAVEAASRRPAPTPARQYVSLMGWAGAHGLSGRWRGDKLLLSGGSTELVFTRDSREAFVNGVQVWLLFPLSSRGAMTQISQIDADSTLEPILSPPKARTGSKIRTICLDAGHGGKDSGSRYGSALEKKYTLLLAQELRSQLVKAGFRVTMTRSTDRYIDLDERPVLAKRMGADLFLSLHLNSAGPGGRGVRGVEVYSLTPPRAPSTNAGGEGADSGAFPGNRNDASNLFLAYQLQRALVRTLGAEDRGVHRARFAVLREAVMPAALIEAGFLSHPVEGGKVIDPSYRREVARGIVQGLLSYKRKVERGA